MDTSIQNIFKNVYIYTVYRVFKIFLWKQQFLVLCLWILWGNHFLLAEFLGIYLHIFQ